MQNKLNVIIVVAFVLLVFANTQNAFCQEKTSILVLCQKDYVLRIDPEFRERLKKDDFYIEAISYDQATWDILKRFNVLAIYGFSGTDSAGKNPLIDDIVAPLVYKFLQQGGGVLFFVSLDVNIKALNNNFLSKMGAKALPEYVFDTANTFRQKSFLQWEFASTTNMAKHPVTQGIDKLIYPIHWTYTMTVDDTWNILIAGEESSYSSEDYHGKTKGMYNASPPLLATRDYDNGRVAFFSMHQMQTIGSGFHRYYEELIVTKGNGYKLLNNLFDWLAAPTLASKTVGGYKGKGLGVKEEIKDVIVMQPTIEQQQEPLNVYKGIIGIHSTFSGAKHSPKEWCDKAEELGYDYVVFTENFAAMDEAKWEELKKVCKGLSDSSFQAIPGVECNDGAHPSKFIGFDFKYWFPPDQIEGGRLKHFYYSRFLFTQDETGYTNPCGYEGEEFLGFHDSILLNVYDFIYRNKPPVELTNLWDQYLFRNKTYCGRNPLTLHKLYNLDDFIKVDGFLTYVWAPSIEDLHKSFHFSQNKNLWGHSTFVSNGPIIKEFKVIGTGWVFDWWESYYLWKTGGKCKIIVDITDDELLEEVIIYRGFDVYRRFKPNTTDFRVEIDHVFDRGGPFIVLVKNVKGQKAITTYKNVRHDTWWTHTCTDNQNFILTGFLPTDNKRAMLFFKGQRRAVVNGMGIAYWFSPGITGWLTTDYAAPEGTEVGGEWGSFSPVTSTPIIGEKGTFSPKVHNQEWKYYYNEKGAKQLNIPFDSGDINALNSVAVFENPEMPELDRKIRQDLTHYGIYSPVNTFNMIYVEKEIEFLEDVKLGNRDGLEITIGSLSANPNFFEKYTYFDQFGQLHKGDRDTLDVPIMDKLPKNGPALIYPQILGNGGIFPLDDNHYDIELTKNAVSIGYNWPEKIIEKGTKLKSRFLIARSSGETPDDTDMVEFYDMYGLDGTHSFEPNLTHGRLIDTRFFMALEAKGFYVEGTLPAVKMPASTPITVTQLNVNWPCGFYDKKAKTIRRLGIDSNAKKAYYAFDDYGTEKDFVVGNLLVCDDMDLVLNLIDYDQNSVTFEAHNPTDEDIKATIRSLEPVDVIPYFEIPLTIPAGTSVVKVITQ